MHAADPQLSLVQTPFAPAARGVGLVAAALLGAIMQASAQRAEQHLELSLFRQAISSMKPDAPMLRCTSSLAIVSGQTLLVAHIGELS